MTDWIANGAAATRPLHAVRPDAFDAFVAMLAPAQRAWLTASGFRAAAGELALLPGRGGIAAAVLGLGGDGGPWAFGGLSSALPEGTDWRLEPGNHDPGAAVLGWGLGAYAFSRYKAPKRRPARLVLPAGTEEALAMVDAIGLARDLINTPAADLGPAELATAATDLAARHGATCGIVEGEALQRDFPTVAAVGCGSPRAPRVAILRWDGAKDGPLIALCGKGVCFDTGGLDLKPSSAMLRMKKDMGGAAVVLGLAELVMRRKLPVRLLVMVGAVENAVSGTAMRPMDVIRTRKGLTVEVGNTDAEGRLVLCDLLDYAAGQSPDLILDCATLTGAARVALGPDLPALFANDDVLAEGLLAAGRAAHDPLWRLPLHDGYDPWLDSRVADLSNVSVRPMAGAVTAALFLRRFVPAGTPWAHLDLYAWNDASRPGRPEGGEATALRALYRYLSEHASKKKHRK